MVKYNQNVEYEATLKPRQFRYGLETLVDDSRRNEKEWLRLKRIEEREELLQSLEEQDWREEQEFRRWYRNHRLRSVLLHEEDVALYVVLRTDEDISSELTFGQYMDYAAQAMVIGKKMNNTNGQWEKTGCNRVILSAENIKRVTDLITYAENNSIPYKVLYRKGYGKQNRLSKRKALIGIVLGPYNRKTISKATDHLPLF